jgi:protein lifeguard
MICLYGTTIYISFFRYLFTIDSIHVLNPQHPMRSVLPLLLDQRLFSFLCVLICLLLCKTGKVILEAAVLTAVVVVSLTLYTFWAAKRGYDFNFLGPFLFASLMALIVFGFIQVRYFVYSLFLLFVQYIIR